MVISAMRPSSRRRTSSLNARNWVSPGGAEVAGGCRLAVGSGGEEVPLARGGEALVQQRPDRVQPVETAAGTEELDDLEEGQLDRLAGHDHGMSDLRSSIAFGLS
jgi:hypothetical protein